MFTKVPLESASSTLSSLVTLTTPGVSADSNGLFHGLGDHASNSFSVDGQSITDQQSKVFSNQLPANSIQSIEVISGAPPAEYGGKTSLVIVATTRSGQGVTTPTGAIYASYGSFGSAAGGFDLSYGGKSWGNFIEVDGLNTGRFLDPPEFTVFHDKGNEENFFDRVDYSLDQADSIHFDLNYSRSWFQTPNSYDNLNVMNVDDHRPEQRYKRQSNLRERGQHRSALQDQYLQHLAHLHAHHQQRLGLQPGRISAQGQLRLLPKRESPGRPGSIQPANLVDLAVPHTGQRRLHADYSYVKGVHNLKIGAQYEQTFLREHDSLGVVDPTYSVTLPDGTTVSTAPCVDGSGNPLPGFTNPSQCAGAGEFSNASSVGGSYYPTLAPYDLTRGGTELSLLRSHRRKAAWPLR